MRAGVLAAIMLLALSSNAAAHSPATAIGRAVEALGQVSVSYDPGSLVSDVEAGNFPRLVGSDVRVAFMPTATSSEIAGGPNAVASEIAREASLDGTLIVLVGAQLGAWSSVIEEARLDELVLAAEQGHTAGSPAAAVASLVRSIQAEPTPSGTPWGWLGAGLFALALAGLVGYLRLARRWPLGV